MLYRIAVLLVRFIFRFAREFTSERLTGTAMLCLGIALAENAFSSPILDVLTSKYSVNPYVVVTLFIISGILLVTFKTVKSFVYLAFSAVWLFYSMGGLMSFVAEHNFVYAAWSLFSVLFPLQIYIRKFLMEFVHQYRLHISDEDAWLFIHEKTK